MSEKKYRSIGVNAVLNTIKSGLSIVFPLITYPYAFRVLHASGIGKVDYSTSIVGYFLLLAALGVNTYAIREGAKVRDSKEKLDEFASQVFSINVISTIITYVTLFLCLYYVNPLKEYSKVILVLSLSIGFSTLGVEWINTIYEDYLYITIRSILTHILSLILLFIIVRSEEDYLWYAFLTVLTNAIICIMNWFYCRKSVTIRFTFRIDWKTHIKPIMILFANSIATTIYVSVDTTMLGAYSGDVAVGLYSIAVKIYSVVKRLLVSMYSVAIPRIAYHWGNDDIKNVKSVYTKLLSNIIILLLPASIGMICTAREIILLMGGEEYISSTLTLQILSVALVGAILGGTVSYCLNIPIGKENINVVATILSASINILLNILLIPRYNQNGAALTTAISEFFVFIFCVIRNRDFKNFVDLQMLTKNIKHALLGCMSIVVVSSIAHLIFYNTYILLLVIIVVSVVIYALELIVLKNEFVEQILGKIGKKIKYTR